ncbi:MAG: hypothetical protein GY827_04140 [Cytophagales bacterium]|nr:hypothetical protein [Cytophagales bacterium]
MRKTADRKKEVFKEIETNNDYVNLETPIAKIEDNLNTFLKSKEGKSFKAANP